jgi:CDP-diglyceride synthetase
MTANPPKKSDLGVRVLSAIVMVAVTGTALWLGGWAWTLFVAAVGLGVLWEWWGLVRGFVLSSISRAAWLIGGLVYVGLAVATLLALRGGALVGWTVLVCVILGVIGTRTENQSVQDLVWPRRRNRWCYVRVVLGSDIDNWGALLARLWQSA